MSRMTLYCFPYAGGSAGYYTKWKAFLDGSIDLQPIDIAGTGKGVSGAQCNTFEEAVKGTYGAIESEIDKAFFALFGHSLGAIVAFEVARVIRDRKKLEPAHMFFSGMRPPHVSKDESDNYHKMSNDELVESIVRLGGIPEEWLDHTELIDVFLPTLRNELMLAENYTPKSFGKPFNCDITVMMGREDDVNIEKMDEWKMYTSGKCSIQVFKGGHFYIHDETENITDIINDTLVRKHEMGKSERKADQPHI